MKTNEKLSTKNTIYLTLIIINATALVFMGIEIIKHFLS
jgi:hypothetical protein